MQDNPRKNQQRRTLLPVEGEGLLLTFLASAVRPSLKSTQAWVSR